MAPWNSYHVVASRRVLRCPFDFCWLLLRPVRQALSCRALSKVVLYYRALCGPVQSRPVSSCIVLFCFVLSCPLQSCPSCALCRPVLALSCPVWFDQVVR